MNIRTYSTRCCYRAVLQHNVDSSLAAGDGLGLSHEVASVNTLHTDPQLRIDAKNDQHSQMLLDRGPYTTHVDHQGQLPAFGACENNVRRQMRTRELGTGYEG